MAQEQNISTQLNNLLVTRNFHPETLDRQGKPSDASDAKTFTFDYVSGSGKNYGTMVIVMDSDDDMKVFYGDNLGRAMEGDDKDEFFDFQQQLSKFANAHRWTYTGTDLSQLKHTMQGLAAIQEGLFEGYYGTRKISYAGEPTEARLMIKHNRTLGEADARFRYVESLFIETADGERFKLPFKNLSGGRAMLEHVRQGGNPYDVRGVHIAEMVQEIGTLSRFNRASATRVMEGATQELIAEAQSYYKSLRENMKRMASPRGYRTYFETWHPATIDEQQELVENIKTLFIEQTLDTRIEAALPLLARIQQQGNAMKEAEIFENWANNLVEGTWAVPETPEQENKLRELLSSELIVGPDATNATEQLYDLIGDDELFDRLAEIASKDPNADVRDAVIDRLKELGYDLGIETNPAPEQSVPVAEGRMLDEAGETMDHILNRFKHEVDQFEAGEEMDSDLYYALFDYYSDHGEIPYGIAKGRDGDPFEWVTQRLVQDLGISEGWKGALAGGLAGGALGSVVPALGTLAGAAAGAYAGHKLGDEGFKDPDAAYKKAQAEKQKQQPVKEGSCNMTMEGEYCPEHGLKECGGMYEMGTVAGGMAPVVGEGHDDPINYNGAITGSYYESKESDTLLARIKSLALLK